MREPATPQLRKPPARDATERPPWLAVPGVVAAPQLSGARLQRAVVGLQPRPGPTVVHVERVRLLRFVGADARPRHRRVSFRWLAERPLRLQSPGNNAGPILCLVGFFRSEEHTSELQSRFGI